MEGERNRDGELCSFGMERKGVWYGERQMAKATDADIKLERCVPATKETLRIFIQSQQKK